MTLIETVKAMQKDLERSDRKELLRMRRDNTTSFLREEFPRETDMLMNVMEEYTDIFPDISQALLIAVEALEHYAKKDNWTTEIVDTEEDSFNFTWIKGDHIEAEIALNKITNLSK